MVRTQIQLPDDLYRELKCLAETKEWSLAETALAARKGFRRRRIHDARLALSLRRQGVREFATANVRDFEDFGFERVWNPLDTPGGSGPQ